MNRFNLLLIDDDFLVHETAKIEFDGHGIYLSHASNGRDGISLFKKNPLMFPVVLLDYSLPDIQGDDVLKRILEINPDQYIVMYSADQSRDTLKKTLLAGAVDFIEKDLDVEIKVTRLKEFYSKWKTLNAVYDSSKELSEQRAFINSLGQEGQSKELYELCRQVELISHKDSTVLIRGASGTGKSDLAKAIARTSKRKDYPFITVNCGAISEKLFESEFFGHKKGSFTGAEKDKKGYFESYNHGTIFLDEIGDLPLYMQVKLLRAIQDQVITPVGSTKEIKINVRIIAATNKDLEKEIERGSFREDLYYRINVINFDIPSLESRSEDIPLLVNRFLKDHDERDYKVTLQALKHLEEYHWPGNIRELKNEIEKVTALMTSDVIKEENLSPKIFQKEVETLGKKDEIKSLEAVKLKQDEIERSYWKQKIYKLKGCTATETLERILKSENISKTSLYRKLKRLNIKINIHQGAENVL